ncbi:hypothetical protein MMC11_002260 [Xylographa trunciseda]|nr:hypothetical protein [Xylographa trunciseda]
MPTFRCQGQDWELPNITPESLPNVRPSLFISYFFAIETNKREPASSNNKHFLTEAFRALLEYKLGYRQGGDDMAKALQRWKDDKYWTVGHGGPSDPFSTRNNPNSHLEGHMVNTSQNMDIVMRPDKEYECFFWRRNGFCKFSDDDCVYAHYPTGKVKEYIDAKDKANYVKAYKNSNNTGPKQECFYWTQGTCRFSDEKCLFAHYPVNRISDHPEWRERGRDQEPPDSFRSDNAMITYPAKLVDKQLECYYWRNTSFCKYTEDECMYAHHPTGRVKELPGMPKSMEIYRGSSETRYAPEVKRPEKDSPKAVNGVTSYAMPEKSTMKLSELTLSAFHDLFCYTNPTARKDRPWEALLTSYKDYVTRHFGKDTLKHVIAAYSRTKLPIPSDLLKGHITQLEAELASKTLLGPLESEVSNNKGPVDSSKRPRSSEDEVAGAAPKRMKSEREGITALPEPDIVTEFLRQIPRNDDQESQERIEQSLPKQSARLYSPSMPHVTTSQPSFSRAGLDGNPGHQIKPAEQTGSRSSVGNSLNTDTPQASHFRPNQPAAQAQSQAPAVISPHRPTTAMQGGSRAPANNISATAARDRSASPKVGSKENDVNTRDPGALISQTSLPGLSQNGRHTTSPPLFRKHAEIQPESSPQSFAPIMEVRRDIRNGHVQSPSSSRHQSDVGQTRKEDYEHATFRRTHNDVSPTSRIGAQKAMVNGVRSPGSSLTRMSHSNMLAPSEPRAGVSQTSLVLRKESEDQRNQTNYVLNGDSQVEDSLHVLDQAMTPKPAPKVYGYREEMEEPLTAHIVRLDALLRGALLELESLKRIVR